MPFALAYMLWWLPLGSSSIHIKGSKEPGFVRPHIGLHTFEHILADEERPFHCAVMSPERNGTSRAIEDSALVRELEHGPFSVFVTQCWLSSIFLSHRNSVPTNNRHPNCVRTR
jgi:hypothetical protein